MTSTTTTAAAPATATSPARVVPTASQPVRIAWQDLLEQFLVHETPLLEQAGEMALKLGAGTIPGGLGSLMVSLLGPEIAKQAVDAVLLAIKGPLSNPNLAIAVPPGNTIENMAANMLNAAVPNFVQKAEGLLDGWIKAAVAKIGG